MNLIKIYRRLPRPVQKALVSIINNIGPLRRFVSKRTINRYANKTPPRPRAVSMAADYTTWRGLTDRRWTGRHLPGVEGDTAPARPDREEVVNLFRRVEFKPATDTSLLFPLFAQWFVDSFLRTKWEPEKERQFRQNESNHEIDLCQIYGIGETQTTMLREGEGGRLLTQEINGESWPAPLFEGEGGKLALAKRFEAKPGTGEDDFGTPGLYSMANFRRVYESEERPWDEQQKRNAFAAGLEHGSSTLGNSAMNTLFLREHNRVARILEQAYRGKWDDERLFQTARNVTTVILLKIVISDYIVHIAPIDVRLEAVPGQAEQQRWYRNNWMSVEFALLYRWHDLIPDEFEIAGNTLHGMEMLRANQLLVSAGLDRVLLDASRQHAGRIGLGNTADFLIDVKRQSIEMARACKLPSYNAYRRYYRLKPISTFEELTRDPALAAKLRDLYHDMERLEWCVGLFAEGYTEQDTMGELLITMVANDAFTQALTNPLLAESVYNEKTFSPEGLEIIRSTRGIADVIARNTKIGDPSLVGFTVR